MSKSIVKKEIRYAWHLPANERREDTHYIKQVVTYSDGTRENKAFLIENFERPVWVTKAGRRNYNDKKEFSPIDDLVSRRTTESNLVKTTAGLLDAIHLTNNAKKIKDSPYVYGYDITSTSLIKHTSLKKNNFIQSAYTVATFDIETNPNTNEILMVTATMEGKIHTAIMNSFLKGIHDKDNRIKQALARYLPQYTGYDFKLTHHDDVIDMLKVIFRTCDDWAPDFLAIWNMDFDISRIMEALEARNIHPADVICDPRLPRHLRVCKYRRGVTKKVTASGVVKPVSPSLQWHTLITTSRFYVIDAMCVYRQLRMAKAEEPSYSLDAILKKELNTAKLKFEEANQYSGLKWHLFMQANYPVEYIIYNIYDCLSMLELEKKNKDLSKSLPDFAGITDFAKFNSQSRKLTDALFLFGLDKGKVIGTAPSFKDEEEIEVSDEEDDSEFENGLDPSKFKTLGLDGWIQLLPQNFLVGDGLQCLEEYPDVKTNIRGVTCDFDAKSSYPSCTLAGNVSKSTCVNEVISISGLSEPTFRQHNLSICLGTANLLEYFTVMFELPNLEELSDWIEQN